MCKYICMCTIGYYILYAHVCMYEILYLNMFALETSTLTHTNGYFFFFLTKKNGIVARAQTFNFRTCGCHLNRL